MVAEREELVGVHEEAVRHVDVEALLRHHHVPDLVVLDARTLGDHVRLAPLVDHTCADLTLVALGIENSPFFICC